MSGVPDPQIVRFGEFELDLRSGELSTGSGRMLLPHQTFRLLAALVQRRGSLVTRDDLRRELWADDTFVDFERSLNAAIRRLREVLVDSAEQPRFIETLPRRGYRFIAEVSESSAAILPSPSTANVAGQNSRSIFRWWALAVAGAAVVGAIVAGALLRQRVTPGDEPRVVRLTNLGTIRLASISSDGRSLAYAQTDGVRESLWVGRHEDESRHQIVPPLAATFRSVTFGPGDAVYYTLSRPDRTPVALYRVPARGGTPEIISEAAGPISFNPDGSRFAQIVTTSIGIAESRVVVADANGDGTRVLAVRKAPMGFARTKPAWSPDGMNLTVVTATAGIDALHELVTIDAADGAERHRRPLQLAVIEDLVALSDDSYIVSARQRRVLPLRLWRVRGSSHALRALTNDVSDYGLAGVMPDGRVVAVRSDTARALWAGELNDLPRARQVATDSGSLEGFEGVAWTPDGHVLYPAMESGNLDLWIIDPISTIRRRLTSDPAAEFHPTVSSDGRTIAFASDRGGTPAIWIMSADGAKTRALTRGPHIRPSLSPDGRWVAVQQMGVDSIPHMLWRVRLDTGDMVRVGPAAAIRPAVSPDGRLIAHYWMTAEQWALAVSPVDGGLPVRTLAIRPTHSERTVRWTPDGKALAFVDAAGGAPNVWIHPLNDTPPRALTNLTNMKIAVFDLSPDGKRLAWTTTTEVRDVVAIVPQ